MSDSLQQEDGHKFILEQEIIKVLNGYKNLVGIKIDNIKVVYGKSKWGGEEVVKVKLKLLTDLNKE